MGVRQGASMTRDEVMALPAAKPLDCYVQGERVESWSADCDHVSPEDCAFYECNGSGSWLKGRVVLPQSEAEAVTTGCVIGVLWDLEAPNGSNGSRYSIPQMVRPLATSVN